MTSSHQPSTGSTLVIPVTEIDAAVRGFVQLGFDLQRIGPADDPTYAVLSDEGCTIRLELGAVTSNPNPHLVLDGDLSALAGCLVDPSSVRPPPPAAEPWSIDPRFTIDKPGSRPHRGRAGLTYRDLIPGRWGGAIIASHIHIDRGGPVPDYVHHHEVAFQLIYCHRGWVEVTYQDQGPSIRLEPGDLFLQPPGIRHRVDRASDDLWVLEVTSPADHPTLADNELSLPNGLTPGRIRGGQQFVHHDSSTRPWNPVVDGLVAQDHGLGSATGGLVRSETWRADRTTVVELPGPGGADGAVGSPNARFLFVLDGRCVLSTATDRFEVEVDTAITLPADQVATLQLETGCRLFVLEAALASGGQATSP